MDFGINQGLVEELYLRFRENPHTVEASWQRYFERLSEADRAALLARGEGAAGARYTSNGNGTHPASNGNGAQARSNGNGAYPTTSNGINGSSNGTLAAHGSNGNGASNGH